MNHKILTNFIVIFSFTASQTFAASFYSEKKFSEISTTELAGDLSFSYSKYTQGDYTREIMEEGLLRVIVDRDSKKSYMSVEQKSKLGFIYFTYLGGPIGWEHTEVSLRSYEEFYKDIQDDKCNSLPNIKNQFDLGDIEKKIKADYLAQVFFDKSCKEKLSENEFSDLLKSTFAILADDQKKLNALTEPLSLACVVESATATTLKTEFQTFRNKIAIIYQDRIDPSVVQKETNLPFPISCTFDGKKQKKCGTLKEGPKSKISFDVSCLKKDPEHFISNAQGMLMHEFMHSVRTPKPFTEEEVLKVDQGYCDFNKDKIIFASKAELMLANQKLIKEINGTPTGAKTIGNDIINPYAAFKAPEEEPSTLASNTTTSSRGMVTRSINSVDSVVTASKSNFNVSVPNIQSTPLSEAHYQAVKKYVSTSVDAISKKIAPVVSYVESPAFAAGQVTNLTPNSDDASGSGAAKEKLSPKNKEVGSPGDGAAKANTPPVANIRKINPSKPTSSQGYPKSLPPEKTKDGALDINLDNKAAVIIRKIILRDPSYNKELRKNGINIKFSDGYFFESPRKSIIYIEKNGLLKRGT